MEAGITQIQLADALGMRQTDISKVERGVRRLDVVELHSWLAALGTSFIKFAGELNERLEALTVQRQAGRRRSARNR